MTRTPGGGITSVFFFRFNSIRQRWWAFKQMRLGPQQLQQDENLNFFKILGTGGGNGFSLFPDFGTYAILVTAENHADLASFSKKNPLLHEYRQRSAEALEIKLKAFKSHGAWGGKSPFQDQHGSHQPELMAVLTRASISSKRLLEFWQYVPGVSRGILGREGLILAKGIGEYPLIEQATISLWRTDEAMRNFAYREKKHAEVVRKTRSRNWYSEELFCRFEVVEISGSWQGEALNYLSQVRSAAEAKT